MSRHLPGALFLLGLAWACTPAAVDRQDAGSAADASVGSDARVDAASPDQLAYDSAWPDAVTADVSTTDLAMAGDAREPDTAIPDAASADARTADAASSDVRAADARAPDSAVPDVAAADAVAADAVAADAAAPDVGVDAGPAVPLLTRQGTALLLDGQPFQRIAMNKFDLFTQFLGEASGTTADVTRPQALQAMDDAVNAGVCCMRVAGIPFWPSNATAFVSDRPAYWAAFDDMMDQAAARGLQIIPVVWWHAWLIPDLAGAPLHDVFVSGTTAHGMLFDYAAELAGRYRDHPALLFWELTNELNLLADLDYGTRTDSGVATSRGTPASRSAADNFTSAEMAALMGALAAHIKSVDPDHLISPGYSKPRPSAWHLHLSPDWQGADWTHDSPAQMADYIALTHPDPLDLVSIHLYPGSDLLGLDGRDPDLLTEYQQAADAIGKPLFVGEFGDTDPTVSEHRSANFTRGLMLKMLERRVPLSLIWVWEFYQFNPSTPSPHSIEPGVDDALIAAYSQIDGWLDASSTARGAGITVVNGGMELDANNNQRVDGWETIWRNGSSASWSARHYSNGSDAFSGTASLRLDSGSGDPGSFAYALSDPIAVSGGEDVVLSAAIRRHLQGGARMRFTLVEQDSSGAEVRINTLELDDALGWVFRVEHQRVQLRQDTRSVRIRLGAGGEEGTLVDVDAVRLFQIDP